MLENLNTAQPENIKKSGLNKPITSLFNDVGFSNLLNFTQQNFQTRGIIQDLNFLRSKITNIQEATDFLSKFVRVATCWKYYFTNTFSNENSFEWFDFRIFKLDMKYCKDNEDQYIEYLKNWDYDLAEWMNITPLIITDFKEGDTPEILLQKIFVQAYNKDKKLFDGMKLTMLSEDEKIELVVMNAYKKIIWDDFGTHYIAPHRLCDFYEDFFSNYDNFFQENICENIVFYDNFFKVSTRINWEKTEIEFFPDYNFSDYEGAVVCIKDILEKKQSILWVKNPFKLDLEMITKVVTDAVKDRFSNKELENISYESYVEFYWYVLSEIKNDILFNNWWNDDLVFQVQIDVNWIPVDAQFYPTTEFQDIEGAIENVLKILETAQKLQSTSNIN